MKKMKTRITALLGALALTAWGIGLAGCFTSIDDSDDNTGGSGGKYELLVDGGPSGRIKPTAPTTPGSISVSSANTYAISRAAVPLAAAGSYNSLAEALAAAADASSPVVITLAPGTYDATGLKYKGKNDLTIRGSSSIAYGTDVLIVGQGSDMTNEATRSLLSFEGSANIVLENLTLKNSHGETTGSDAQAETLGVSNNVFTGTLAVYNCSFLSGQDTICTQGKAWFYHCYIEGDVDFIWMEGTKPGARVALYEECIIRAIGTRSSSAYIAAPRLAKENSVWKGVVFYNSILQAETGLKNFYLGRNPWNGNSAYYENVAIVACRLQLASGVTLHSDIWKGNAYGTSNQQYVGFKTDDYFTKPASGSGARLTSAQIAADYAGRENILNRYYDFNSSKFKQDAEAYWDINALIAARGWNATPDTSSSLGAGETKVNSKKYDMMALAAPDSATLAEGSADGISWKGLEDNGNKEWKQAKNGATVTFSVDEPSVVKLEAYQNGVGELSATVGGTKVVDSASACSETAFLTSGAGEVVITFTGQTYFKTITVLTRTDEANKAGAVKVTLSDTQIAKDENTTAAATVTPYYLNNTGSDAISNDVTWSSSKPTIATVNASSGAVSGVAAGTADIIATSKATPSLTGKATLTVTATATTVVPLVTWDWKNDGASINYYTDKEMQTSAAELQGKTGYAKGSSNKVLLYVDATSGALKTRSANGDAQFNNGTKIQVPVSSGSVVTIVSYPSYHNYTIAGTAASADTHTYTASSSGYVEIISTATAYLFSISVTNVDSNEAHTSVATGTLQ